MKYYCKNCGAEYRVEGERDFPALCTTFDGSGEVCDTELIEVSDYETPEQYKERTGKPYPDNGLVWYRLEKIGEPVWTDWCVGDYKDALFECRRTDSEGRIYQMVIADPPVPPPGDWRPEVNDE